jgi:hypothetical protein
MELFAEAVSVIGALLLSVSCGLLVEELFFGGLVRLFFTPRPMPVPSVPRQLVRKQSGETAEPIAQGEKPCLR